MSTLPCTSLAAQHSTAQHSTAQHSTAQHSTAQHSTAQHIMHPVQLNIQLVSSCADIIHDCLVQTCQSTPSRKADLGVNDMLWMAKKKSKDWCCALNWIRESQTMLIPRWLSYRHDTVHSAVHFIFFPSECMANQQLEAKCTEANKLKMQECQKQKKLQIWYNLQFRVGQFCAWNATLLSRVAGYMASSVQWQQCRDANTVHTYCCSSP